MPIYYLAARPETIISIIHTGLLPENLPPYIEEAHMNLFPQALTCTSQSMTSLHQTFVVQLNLPIADQLLNQSSSSNANESYMVVANQIECAWIQKICVFSERGRQLVTRLFNQECPVPIEINAEFFSPTAVPSNTHESLPIHTTIAPASGTRIKQGDILGSRMQTVINTVNCVGVMGKGIALQFKERYPAMFEDYKQRCKRQAVKLGEPYLYKIDHNRWIINFPTKGNWRSNSKLYDIEQGLHFLAEKIPTWGITSLAVPPLGCGNGGLAWVDVLPLIHQYLDPLNIEIEIYAPILGTKADHSSKKAAPVMTDFFKNTGEKRKNTSEGKAQSKKPLLKSSSFHGCPGMTKK